MAKYPKFDNFVKLVCGLGDLAYASVKKPKFKNSIDDGSSLFCISFVCRFLITSSRGITLNFLIKTKQNIKHTPQIKAPQAIISENTYKTSTTEHGT